MLSRRAQPFNLRRQKEDLEVESCGPGDQGEAFYFWPCHQLLTALGRSPVAVLPVHRGVRGPLSFTGHGEASLVNICKSSETFLS